MTLARLVTALQSHLAEPMMTHQFIDEDADLACQDLSDWEKQFFAEIGDKPNENNGSESDKENEEEKEETEETEEEITLSKASEMFDKLKTSNMGYKGITAICSDGGGEIFVN